MKTIVKIIWFSVAFTLGTYLFNKFVTVDKLAPLMDKLPTPGPIKNWGNSLITGHLPKIQNVIIFTIMFLGLDVIHGEVKGIIAGPFKFILNMILYLIGFTIIFTITGLIL